jgi:nitrogen-specific signal transduction histidine kinase
MKFKLVPVSFSAPCCLRLRKNLLHQLRNPMAALQLIADLLERTLAGMSCGQQAEITLLLQKMRRQVEVLDRLTDQASTKGPSKAA